MFWSANDSYFASNPFIPTKTVPSSFMDSNEALQKLAIWYNLLGRIFTQNLV